ncbi:hypothetical protein [Stenotrophomonas sp. 24(2023)]|uniref:hypothetical protein n=1 Tax=Stenotrophomonas sp. 24(2023) TaxID=3068324 RepID=UPI0027DFE9FC|nr:hypothetical protein [Stenotrophomonas sp. 24(2023)]WMJ69306.1 hypothetical protein Q9R17_19350 [Stenotrophomonas sp. 24(2023)]
MPLRLPSLPALARPSRQLLRLLLGLYGCYLLAGNVFLNTPLFDTVTDRKPHKFVMETGPAITLWPGHITAWNVRMRGHANHTVYVLRAERASGRIALWPLLRREVRIPRIEAVGVSAEIDRVAKAVPPPPRSDQGWTLRFDAIHTETLYRLRLGTLLLHGQGRGTVGFLKQLKGGPSELFDSRVQFKRAYASYGGIQLLSDLQLDARFHYPRHYRDQAPGLAKLGLLSATLALDARSQGLRVDTQGTAVTLGGTPTAGHLRATLGMDHGALRPGSHLQWRLPLQAGDGAPDRGMLALQLDTARDIRVQARLPRDATTGSELQADLHVATRRIPFQHPAQLLPHVSGTVRGRWQFTSLNWIADLFVRKPWFRLDGGGLLEADLRVRDGELAPGSTVDIPSVAALADVAGVRLQGTAQASGRLQEGTPNQLRLAVSVPRFKAAPADAPDTLLFDGHDLAVLLQGDGRLQELHRSVRAKVDFTDARVPDLAAYNRYLGKGQVRLLGGSGTVSGQVELDTGGEIGRGSADLRGSGARLQVGGIALQGDAQLKARLQRADIRHRQFDLAGTTVALRNIQLDDAGDGRWWGQLGIRQGHIDGTAPFQVDALADLRLRDAAPLMALFAARGDYPRWALGLLDAGEVQASTRLRWRREHLVMDALQAENDRLSVRARLDLDDARRQGDLYLRWGVLGAAVRMEDRGRTWHLAGAREWYDAQPALLPPMPPAQATD